MVQKLTQILSPPRTLNGPAQRPRAQRPAPLRAPPALGPLSVHLGGAALRCPWSREVGQPGARGGEKTLVVLETTHGHRMPFQKMWVGPSAALWGRRPCVRRKTIRNKLSIGARRPGVRSATWSLAV